MIPNSQILHVKQLFLNVFKEIIASIIVVIVANIIIIGLFPKQLESLPVLTEINITILIILGYIGVRSIIFISMNFDIIEKINDISKSLKNRNVRNEILKKELSNFEHTIKGIFTTKGGILNYENSKIFYKYLYDIGGKEYYSTDLHIPSPYEDQNWNLEKQKEFNNSNKKEGKRIIILEKEDIKYDYILHKKKFEDFEKENAEIKVDIRIIEPNEAQTVKDKYRLSSCALGIWYDSHSAHYDTILSEDLKKVSKKNYCL